MPHNFVGINNKMENFRKGTFLDAYDEPVYLTFALDFKFEDDSVSQSSLASESRLGVSPLFNQGGDPKSSDAINFLTNRGYTQQAHGLTVFREILRYLTFQAPWYFQSISGVDKMFEQATDQNKGWKAKDINLTVETLEALDLRITELAALYRNAIFDTKYRRERVPDNLRWFSMDIYIAEFRNLRYRLPGQSQQIAQSLGVNTAAIGSIVGGGNLLTNVMDQFGYIKFSCRQCEFDFSKSVPFKTSISVGGDNRAAEGNKFGIKVGWFEEEYKFGDGTKLYEDPAKADIRNPWGTKNAATSVQNFGSFLSGLPVIGDDLANIGQKAKDGLAQVAGLTGINTALGAAASFVNPPIESIGDSYNTGYASNGDEVPGRGTPPNQNVYGG
jgi:hypothetical protein